MSSARKSPTVLVVDDEPPIRLMLHEALSMEGYPIEVAKNGQEAIAILENAPVMQRIMLLDLTMPGIDGWGVVRWLVEHPEIKRRTRVVLMSAAEKLRLASDLEHDAELTKPFGIDALLKLVAAN